MITIINNSCSFISNFENILPYKTCKIENIYEVNDYLNLDITTNNGTIKIVNGEKNKLKVIFDYKVIAKSQDDALRVSNLIQNDLPIEIIGNTVQIGDIRKYNLKQLTSLENVFFSYSIEAPYNTVLDVFSGIGNLSIENIEGPVRLNTNSGNLIIKKVEKRVDANTLNGNINAEDLLFSASLTTTKGNIILYRSPNDLFLKTGLGNIFLDSNVSSNVNWKITTSLGNIEIILPSNPNVLINAKTDFGSFKSDFQITSSFERENEVEGTIGINPFSKITLKTGSGNISLKKIE